MMERVFRGAGLPCEAVYTHEGHSFYTWRHLIKDMLVFFYGEETDARTVSQR